MEDLCSLWSYQEKWGNIDELKHKLLYTELELETAKMGANEERRKHEENMKHLLNLLKLAHQEKDEAKKQLSQLLEKFTPSSISESNSTFSDAFNNNYYESSPIDSLFDVVSSPQQPSLINLETQDYGDHDKASVLINNLAKNKVLPKQGRLLEAVMDAGPLLQTLLVAGPLPKWRNPPPLQSFKIPHVSDNDVIQSHLNGTLSPYAKLNSGCSDRISNWTPIFNFSGGPGFAFDREFSSGKKGKRRLH